MVTSANASGSAPIPDAMVRAAAQLAERHAHLVGTYLRQLLESEDDEAKFPAGALIELAAVLQLGVWERTGLLPNPSIDVPAYREASGRFVARCLNGPDGFRGPHAAELSWTVLCCGLNHFAWDGPEFMQADVLLGDLEEDTFVDLLAEFVWSHRAELKHLLQGDQQE